MLLDIIVVAIIVIMAYVGSKTGLIRSVFNLGYFFVAALISAIVYPVISTFLINTSLAGIVRDKVSEWLVANGSGVVENLPDFLSGALNLGVNAAMDSLATSVTQLMINLISIVAVFILVKIGLKFAGKAFDAIMSLPVLSSVNKAGGFIIGLFNGLFVVYFLLAVAAFFVSSGVTDMIAASTLANMMYHENLLLKLIFR